MIAASGGAVLGVVAVIAWLMTGRSPFLLAVTALLFCEAVRAEAWMCVWPAVRIFARRVRKRFALVRAQVGVAA